MKKSLFFGLVAFLGLIGCSRNQEIDIPDANLSLFARTESPSDTKTVVESGVHVYWEPGDEIAVFMGEKAARFTTDITAASGTATFKGTFGDTTWPEEPDLWAVYPYSEDAAFDGETITTVLPSEQVAREGSFGKDMNLAIAHSNSSTLQFYNVGGGIRFSVTEDGIKKVMFEGLSGEIISGKVKIGLDENGKPEVQEVTGGSQFITLRPPSGKDTFEKDTWYYIVAIPGALASGYKLRFYKDSDYARKVFEKAVEIKRSIFGSLDNADKGIEYEATTTKFPETKEEFQASCRLMSKVNSEIKAIMNRTRDISTICKDAARIEGIIDVLVGPSDDAFAIQQKDSVWLNFFLDKQENAFTMTDDDANHQSVNRTKELRTSEFNASLNHSQLMSGNVYINRKRKAIILAPYVFGYNLNGFKQDLIDAGLGYSEEDIVIKREHDVLITDFLGSNLSQYDVIMIVSHGGSDGCYAYQQPNKPLATIIDTGVPFTEQTAEVLINSGKISLKQAAFIGGEDEATFAMTVDYLMDVNFNNACVFLMACHSAERCYDKGSLVKGFLDRGAGLVSGNNRTVNSSVTYRANRKITYLMSKGLSFQNSFEQIKGAEHITDFCNYWYEYVLWYDTNVRDEPEGVDKDAFDVPNFYVIKENSSLSSKEYFFIDPFPSSLSATSSNGSIILRWDCRLRPFIDLWEYPDPNRIGESDENMDYLLPKPIDTYNIVYDVFIDGCQVEQLCNTQESLSDNIVTWSPESPGKQHKWYVNASIVKNNIIIATYRTDGEPFTVTELPSASIQTNDPTNIGPCSAEIPFSISTEENIYGYGVVYSTNNSNPTTDDHGDGNYLMPVSSDVGNSIVISHLTPNTTYYARAFITLNEENGIKLYGNTIQFTTKGISFNTQYEDLGLSVKWATCNLGSSTPSNVGGFYRWGETSVRSSSKERYKWGVFPNYTKYNASDGKTTLEAEDDAAYVNLGEKWRMPTNDELTELRNSCTWTQAIKNGVRGCTVTGPNGKSIFIPISGGNKGYYHADILSSSLSTDPDDNYRYVHALRYLYDDNTVRFLYTYRDGGTPIRPVYDDGTQIPQVSFSPSSYAFGDVSVGETATSQAFTFTNSGNATLNVTVESCPDGFTTSPNVGGSFPIKAGDSRTGFVIRFSPKQAKSYGGTVVLSTNDPNNPKLYISVSGRGVSSQASEPLISVSPDSYDFGSVTVGQYARTTITIKNTGTADLEVSSIRLLDGSQGFELGTTASAGTVAPGDTKSFGVRFLPQSKGYAADQILIKSNASINSSKLVTLTGTGI